jgi:DNA relaxase NicK
MISLFLSVCLQGQPCKEERVADFFTVMATEMCSTNKFGMQTAARNEKRQGTFECHTDAKPATIAATAKLNFDLTVANGQKELLELARFYGKGGQPLCAKNADHYRADLMQAATETKATAKLECVAL